MDPAPARRIHGMLRGFVSYVYININYLIKKKIFKN